ncbi:hypothetical protein HHI36_014168 [Cryptolaemus montrouzieri]|uniref:BHLH domain-containing protein n=1 Tax=Cryptolaemus montrouzieri TaxID=559131 RepID=A0ABD2N327_9CUCU
MATMTIEHSENLSESNNSIAARREARRRKILENAETRLKKLTGVEQKSKVTIDDFRPIRHGDQDFNTVPTNHYTHNVQNLSETSSSRLSELLNSNSNLPSESVDIQGLHNQQQRISEHRDHKLYFLIGSAFLANVLLTFSTIFCDEVESNISFNMIFIPF